MLGAPLQIGSVGPVGRGHGQHRRKPFGQFGFGGAQLRARLVENLRLLHSGFRQALAPFKQAEYVFRVRFKYLSSLRAPETGLAIGTDSLRRNQQGNALPTFADDEVDSRDGRHHQHQAGTHRKTGDRATGLTAEHNESQQVVANARSGT